MVKIENLCMDIGVFSLKNIDFEIAKGACHAVLGPTGSGKTVLLETVIGIQSVKSGRVIIDGRDVSALSPAARDIAYVPQDICLFPHMSVMENIMYGVRVRKLDPSPLMPMIDELIDFLGIRPILGRNPSGLSGGERQRAAIVRALAAKPRLLILDEPFSAIDSALREDARRLLKELYARHAITSLIVTHDIDEAYFLADQISVLIAGAVVQSGERDDIYNYPKNIAAAEFLGVRNIYDSAVESVQERSLAANFCGGYKINITCGCAQRKFAAGQKIKWAIRSEAVYILKEDSDPAGKSNCFDAEINTIYTRGKMHTVLCAVSGGAVIEIDIHDAAFNKLKLARGKKIKISLNPDSVFIIN